MLNAMNVGSITGRLVADPEQKTDNILEMRLAVDYAGYDRDNPDNRSGFFRVTYFTNEDNQNTRFVKSQIEQGNLKKGSAVSILYSLKHSRYTHEGNRRENVELIAHTLDYSGPRRKEEEGNESNTEAVSTEQTAQSEPQETKKNFIPPEF